MSFSYAFLNVDSLDSVNFPQVYNSENINAENKYAETFFLL